MEETKVTKEEFEDWFGSDHCENINDLTDLILELANGEYKAEQLKMDIEDYS